MNQYFLNAITLEGGHEAAPTPEVEQERKVAIFDLLEENKFHPVMSGAENSNGPYSLDLSVVENRLIFNIQDQTLKNTFQLILSLTPFRQVIKDYFAICEAYFEAVKNLPPAQIEAIDMGRRGIHNEGARLLEERLDKKVDIDSDTARRLFTLISVLHFKG